VNEKVASTGTFALRLPRVRLGAKVAYLGRWSRSSSPISLCRRSRTVLIASVQSDFLGATSVWTVQPYIDMAGSAAKLPHAAELADLCRRHDVSSTTLIGALLAWLFHAQRRAGEGLHRADRGHALRHSRACSIPSPMSS